MLLAPRSMLLPLLLTLCALFLAPVARGQNLSGTDYGKSQNTAQDLGNSLTPGKERVGKGADAARTALEMADLFTQLRNNVAAG